MFMKMDLKSPNITKGTLSGTIIHSEAFSNMQSLKESLEKIDSTEWLYHCTNASNLESILKTREFWLSNLTCVNDKAEVKIIDDKSLLDAFYIASFTQDPFISEEHWEEYGGKSEGVLVAVKKTWFRRKACFLDSENHCLESRFMNIYWDRDEAYEALRIFSRFRVHLNPYYIGDFNFYKIVYDDDSDKKLTSNCRLSNESGHTEGLFVTPDIVGTKKHKYGLSERSGQNSHYKNWEDEKEVRLKLRIQRLDPDSKTLYTKFNRIAVPLSEDAFSELRISFCPSFKDKEGYKRRIKERFNLDVIEIDDEMK